jgi:hypothetical protein
VTRPSRPADAAQLPSLYQPWVEALLGGVIPAESEATCSNCAMLPGPGDAPASDTALFFDPRVKCCTYVPALPNFLVGRILLDTSLEMAAGRASVRARIAASTGVTPMGLERPPVFAVLYARGAAETFGQSVHLRCPHYQTDTGGCGIWRHRQSVCTTWFCKHSRGVVGARFWRALRQLLGLVERSLAVHCVRSLAPGPAAARHAASAVTPVPQANLRASDLDGTPDPAVRGLWGRYLGQEETFYEAAGRLVGAMGWDEVCRLGGVELELAADLLRAAYLDLTSTRLPRALRAGTIQVTPQGAGAVELTSYSAFHPLTVPTALVDVLHVFDGRPTRKAMAAAAEAGVAIERAVVARLVDMGVLVDAESGP